MRFLSIKLVNYIGIYNGMGLYNIDIDMTKCRHKMTIIRGENGSGKSTLSKAMGLFPDPNDAFIPGMPARKEIVLQDGNTLYKLVFIHGIKQNGDRDTTKAYITKTFNDVAVELNENGNVSSYKDILYSELGLDANFLALSQLSNDDRGLADKKPAERKRFVNSIISSLETYNSIYKTLSKRSSNYKSMINAIVAKLNVLGDESSIKSNLDVVESRINELQDMKDRAVTELASANSMISILDPDGSIQLENSKLSSELAISEKESSKTLAILNGLFQSNNIDPASNIAKLRQSVIDKKNSLIIDNQIARGNIESFMREKESESTDLAEKTNRLSSLKSGYNYEMLVDSVAKYRDELQAIRDDVAKVGIDDITSISKEEYILALEILKDLEEHISNFKSRYDAHTMEFIINYYLEHGQVPDRDTCQDIINMQKKFSSQLQEAEDEKKLIQSRIGLLDKLNLRPNTCTDNSCEFIKEAVEFSATNPTKRLEELDQTIEYCKNSIYDLERDLEVNNEINNCINEFAVISREVKRNASILAKMPNGDMFKDINVFFHRLLTGYSFDYMREIYKYIDLANEFDTYKSIAKVLADYEAELKVYESKADIIESLITSINSINESLKGIEDRITSTLQEVSDREKQISSLQERESVFDAILFQMDKNAPVVEKINNLRNKLQENNRKMQDIQKSLEVCEKCKQDIHAITFQLEPFMKERDKLVHTVEMMKDYLAEKKQLETNYEFIETIKYYSSPTTGIQLVFMELYMGKIIALANELLGYLFGGQFVIQPFVINDTEFRIPCLGSGYLNDDISSMSSSQIGMISMILSFALLHHSSTKYNIIKLDEIDGPLDYNNRTYFMDVLNRIMNIMGTEQCIMISHNSELQVDDCDIILLRHDPNNTDYSRGNIIWSY